MTKYQVSGPGTHLARKLRSYGIRYEEAGGCNCYRTMMDMNNAGAEQILKQLDLWEGRVLESARGWFKEVYEKDGVVGRCKRFIGEKVSEMKVRGMIEWACEQTLKDMEWRASQSERA